MRCLELLTLIIYNLRRNYFEAKLKNFDSTNTNLEFINFSYQIVIFCASRHRKESGEHREDFLQMLLEARKENGDNLDDNVAVQQAFLFFVAG